MGFSVSATVVYFFLYFSVKLQLQLLFFSVFILVVTF